MRVCFWRIVSCVDVGMRPLAVAPITPRKYGTGITLISRRFTIRSLVKVGKEFVVSLFEFGGKGP